MGQAVELARRHAHSGVITAPVNSAGLMPLHVACVLGCDALVEALLDGGAKVDVRGVVLAAQRGHAGVVSRLLQHGGSGIVEAAAEAVHGAAWGAHTECVRVLVRAGVEVSWRGADGVMALHLAAVAGDEEMVRALVAGGADVLAKCGGALTAAMWASRAGKTEVVRLLERLAHASEEGKRDREEIGSEISEAGR